jgi:S-adenosylmethionine-diacylglycerol 3-amino-3-carboxypropyl transferase
MGRLGRDPEFFRYVDGNVADRILERVEYALTELSGHDNPYMTYILTGNFGSALPMYLRRDLFEQIRTNLHRLQLVQLPAEEVAGHLSLRFNACNLSDIFEYMSDDQFTSVVETLLDGCHSGGRLAYWNMLVPRRIHNILPQQTRYDSSLSTELFARDRAFFYQAFNIERVV